MTRIVSFELEHYSQSKIKPTSVAKYMPIMSEKVIKISGDLLIIAQDFKTLTSILLKSSDFETACNKVVETSTTIGEELRRIMTLLLKDTYERIKLVSQESNSYSKELADSETSMKKALEAFGEFDGKKVLPVGDEKKPVDTSTQTQEYRNLLENQNISETPTPPLENRNLLEDESCYDPYSISSKNKYGEYMYIDNPLGIPYFSQFDPRWNNLIAENGKNFGSFSCGYTGLAMLVSGATGTEITPPQIFEYLKAQVDSDGDGKYDTFIDRNGDGRKTRRDSISELGKSEGLATWAVKDKGFQENFGIVATEIYTSDIQKSLDDGVGVLVSTRHHYVTIIPSNDTYVDKKGETHTCAICYDTAYDYNTKQGTSIRSLGLNSSDNLGSFGRAFQIMSSEKAATLTYETYRPIK